GPHEETSGPDVRPPPMGYHPDHAVPLHHRCQSPPSWPRANMSMRFGPHDAAPGSDVITPPSGCCALHADPFHDVCHRPLSLPFRKTSSRLGPHEEGSGPDVSVPPNDDQVLAKTMLNDRITVPDGTNTWPPASAGVTKRLIPNAVL